MTRNSFADGAGGMSDVRRTRPEPTAIAPPISSGSKQHNEDEQRDGRAVDRGPRPIEGSYRRACPASAA